MSRPGSRIPVLPDGTTLEYLAEGAANVVSRFFLPRSESPRAASHDGSQRGGISTGPDDSSFLNRLLRLRKSLPSTVPIEESARDFHALVAPLFPVEHLVAQELVVLPDGLVAQCNRDLRVAEAQDRRSSSRRDVYLAEEERHGLLITDMTPDEGKGEVLVEFKPKWLAQSPSAPANPKRCRTCALRARRNAARSARGEQADVSFCPLDLVSGEDDKLRRAVRVILAKCRVSGQQRGALEDRLVDLLRDCSLLFRLRELQLRLDHKGVLESDTTSQDFLLATTLRDCTVFIKVSLQRSCFRGRKTADYYSFPRLRLLL